MAAWPADFPLRVKRDCPIKPGGIAVALKKGDLGRVVNEAKSDRNALWCEMNMVDGQPGAIGWIDKAYVEIGTDRTVKGDGFVFEILAPDVPTVSLASTTYQPSNNVFSSTVQALMHSWVQNSKDFPKECRWLQKEIGHSTQQIPTYERLFTRGVHSVSAELLRMLQSGDFTMEEIADECNVVSTSTDNQNKGIYLIFIDQGEDFDAAERFDVYVGSSGTGFNNRYKSYFDEVKNLAVQRPVIKAIREAEANDDASWSMIPICHLTDVVNGNPKLVLAEQTFMDLFQTYTARAIQFGRSATFSAGDRVETTASSDSSPSSAAGSTTSSNTPPGDGIGRDVAEALASEAYGRKSQCYMMHSLSQQVFDATGWLGCCRRRSTPSHTVRTIRPFGAVDGLNVRAPITEMSNAKIVWAMDRARGGVRTYRRTGFTVRAREKGSGVKVLWQKATKSVGTTRGENTTFVVADVEYPWPPIGTWMHAIAEITDDFSHAPLSMLPALGSPSDWSRASKIAIRFEWLEDGEWVGSYYQFSQGDRAGTNRDADTGVMPPQHNKNYQKSVGLAYYFLQEIRQVNAVQEAYTMDYGTARVKEMRQDWLSQMIRVKDYDRRTQVPGATIRTLREVGAKLTQPAIGLTGICLPGQNIFGTFPQGANANTGKARGATAAYDRTVCDGCFVITRQPNPNKPTEMAARGKPRCELIAGNTCAKCRGFGRPCTFSPSDLFDAPDGSMFSATKFAQLPDTHPRMRALIAPFRFKGKYQGSPENVIEEM